MEKTILLMTVYLCQKFLVLDNIGDLKQLLQMIPMKKEGESAMKIMSLVYK